MTALDFTNTPATSAMFHKAARLVGDLAAQLGRHHQMRATDFIAAAEGLLGCCCQCNAMAGEFHHADCPELPPAQDDDDEPRYATFAGRWEASELPAIKLAADMLTELAAITMGLTPPASEQVRLFGVLVPGLPRSRAGAHLTKQILELAQRRMRLFAGPQSAASRALYLAAADQLEAATPRVLRLQRQIARYAALYDVANQVLGGCPSCHVWPGERHSGECEHVSALFMGAFTEREYPTVQEIAAQLEHEESDATAESLASVVSRLRSAAARPTESEGA